MAKDIYWPDTVLAMHMDAAGFIDLKSRSVTSVGNAAISATQSKFGGSSAYFDGTGDYLQIPSSEDFRFENGNFTVEMWVYRNASTASTILSKQTATTGECSFEMYALDDGSIYFTMYVSTAGFTVNTNAANGIPIGGWHHVAVTRTSNTLNLFVDGVLKHTIGTLGGAVVNYSPTASVRIGSNFQPSNFLNGYIDDVRITKGVARYTATFTPPAAAFPDEAYTVSGTILDVNGNGVVRTVRAYRRDTGALVGSATSLFANGEYSMPVSHDGEVQVVMVDDAAGAVENDQILRTVPV